ncbi:MAG TPA: hypothetical protein VGM05_32190 [Planctomycetaceae bacterium]|jgi:hypothetical protein
METTRPPLQVVLSVLLTAGGLTFIPLAVLGAAGLVDPRFAAVAFGVTLLAAGADELTGVVVAGWVPLGQWPPGGRPTTARLARLSSLGGGLVFLSTGTLLIGIGFACMPPPVLLAAGAVYLLGFALALLGCRHDSRDKARGGHDDAPPDAADRGRT